MQTPTSSLVSNSDQSSDLVSGLPMTENKKFYPALDGLRGFAVLMVFYQHYLAYQNFALSWGWMGVDFFFVLSGFLITGILYDTRNTAHRLRNFYVRRTLRIFPLYYGVLVLLVLLNPFFHWVWHPALYLWPFYLSNYGRFIWLPHFVSGAGSLDSLLSALPTKTPFLLFFGHFWSLCVEEQFYLVWPLVVFLVKDRVRLRNICVGVCAAALAARIACVYLVPQAYLEAALLYRLTPLRSDTLLLGGALALMLRGPEAQWLLRHARHALYLLLAAFTAIEVVIRVRSHQLYHPDVTAPGLSTVGLTLSALFAAVVILFSLEPGGFFYRIFDTKPLRQLGQMSYGFYVFHDIPHDAYLLLVARVIGDKWHYLYVVAGVAFVCTLVLSYLSFRYFESPFLRLKDRWTVPAVPAGRSSAPEPEYSEAMASRSRLSPLVR